MVKKNFFLCCQVDFCVEQITKFSEKNVGTYLFLSTLTPHQIWELIFFNFENMLIDFFLFLI